MKNLAFVLLVCFFISCDEQPIVIPEFQLPVTDRVVLVEELTGVRCPNCPSGSAKLESLIEKFEGQIIGVGIHGDFLTEPLADSNFDFRNEDAVELEFSFSIQGKPSAVINRTKLNGGSMPHGYNTPDQWEGVITEELNAEHRLELSVLVDYDTASRTLVASVTAGAVANIPEELFITVLLSESNIVDAQLDQQEVIPNYVHNHVLRDIITDWNGDVLTDGMQKDEIITREYTYQLPEENGMWVAENIDVVAHVRSSEEILQAAECHGCLE